jgi:hypothetical protein
MEFEKPTKRIIAACCLITSLYASAEDVEVVYDPTHSRAEEVFSAMVSQASRKCLSRPESVFCRLKWWPNRSPTSHLPADAQVWIGFAARRAPGDPGDIYALTIEADLEALPDQDSFHAVMAYPPPGATLRLVRELQPQARHLGFLATGPDDPALRALRTVAADHGFEVDPGYCPGRAEVGAVLDGLLDQVDALLVEPDPAILKPGDEDLVLHAALRAGVAVYGYFERDPNPSTLAGVLALPEAVAAETLGLLEKRFDGELTPMRQRVYPAHYETVINRALAERMGLPVPEEQQPGGRSKARAEAAEKNNGL